MRVSGTVSRWRTACITRRTAGDDADGALALIDFSVTIPAPPHRRPPAWNREEKLHQALVYASRLMTRLRSKRRTPLGSSLTTCPAILLEPPASQPTRLARAHEHIDQENGSSLVRPE